MTTEIDVVAEEASISDNQAALKQLLDHIGNSEATFKPQQIDDPELDPVEKRKIAEKLLFENPVNFLVRFGTHLKPEHLDCFSHFQDNSNGYDLEFHVSELRKTLEESTRRRIIRNRRFEALKRLENEGKYFSETEMENREPLLYYQLVGQFLTEGEKQAKYKRINEDAIPSFSSYLIQRAESDALDQIRRQQEEAELAEAVSSDEDDEEIGESSNQSIKVVKWGADWDDEAAEKRIKERVRGRKKTVKLPGDEKKLLLQEFRTHVYTKFLDGLDQEFEYSCVDSNPEYDCLQERSQDEEEKYFDDETCDSTLCTDTGVLDY